MNAVQRERLTKVAREIREMITKAESSGGSIAEIKNAVKMWDEQATTIDVNENTGHIIVDGITLSDEEIFGWLMWTQSAGPVRNRK